LGKKTCDAPAPPRQKKRSSSSMDVRAIFKSGIPLKCLGPSQCSFFECFL
jgi:hypothetical protein